MEERCIEAWPSPQGVTTEKLLRRKGTGGEAKNNVA
jgi:hypothetical protein